MPVGVALPLPMFPLGTVLFPYVPLPLHVFEPRYRALMLDCRRGAPEFGVVLITRGSEVGGGDQRVRVGTVARIVEALELADGRWEVLTVGERRFCVLNWLPDDPYPVALVEDLPEPEFDERAEAALAKAQRAVRRALALQAELDVRAPASTVELDPDPARASYQLAAIAPVGPYDRQRLLEVETHADRLDLLTRLSTDAAELFAHRLASG